MLSSLLCSLILNYFTSSFSDTQVVIYEIYPSTPDPEFTRKGELTINALVDISSNPGGRFIFSNEMNGIVLWNLATNDSIIWEPLVDKMREVRSIPLVANTLNQPAISCF